jgi:hypothetical protein
MRRADRVRAAIGGVFLIAAGCSASPEPGIPSLQPAALSPGPVAGAPRATLLEKVVLRADGPDGPLLVGDGGNVLALESGRELLVLSEPQAGADGTYVRAWILPSTTIWPGDFVAWVPATRRDGRPTLTMADVPACPGVATIATLAPLLPADRLRCAGSQTLTFDARSWFPAEVPIYDTDPAWYGTNADLAGSTSLFDPGPALFGPDARTSPGQPAPGSTRAFRRTWGDHRSGFTCGSRASSTTRPPPAADGPCRTAERTSACRSRRRRTASCGVGGSSS